MPTNIPTVFEGRIVSEDEAINIIIAAGGKDPITGRQLKGFDSIEQAVKSAESRSDKIL